MRRLRRNNVLMVDSFENIAEDMVHSHYDGLSLCGVKQGNIVKLKAAKVVLGKMVRKSVTMAAPWNDYGDLGES